LAWERWRHIHGCARFFNAVRDTVTDKFVTTYRAGEPKYVVPAKVNAKTPARKKASPKGTKKQ
jgi:sarcosine oxidase subunit delta